MRCKCVMASAVAVLLLLGVQRAQGQVLLTETTWGGARPDVAEGVALDSSGNSYVVGITDSFAADQFGQPIPRIFVVKFAANGSLTWQRIWDGNTIHGVGRPDVAVASDGSVYVTGESADNGGDAVLLKFSPDGTLQWARTWGGGASDEGKAVAIAPDGSVYIAGTETSFGPSANGLFVVKFDSAGNVVWQRIADNAEGSAVAVAADGSVYAAGTTVRDALFHFDMLVVKITASGNQVWRRTYTAGDVADARGRMAAAADGSIVIAGALQSTKAGTSDIAALIVKLGSDGSLVFDRVFDGRGSETADGVATASDGTIYVAGTTSSFGAGSQDAFVVHIQPTGKKLLDAVTWGGTGLEAVGGVSVSGGTVSLAATTETAPPYSFLAAGARLAAPRSTLGAPPGVLTPLTGLFVATPAAVASTPTGSTTFAGDFEAALVRIAR